MSMSTLSTELDEIITGHLSATELAALVRTNKYYQRLAEPRLYRDLVFSDHHTYELRSLFLTILKRNDLAQHIRSFTITKEEADEDSLTFRSFDVSLAIVLCLATNLERLVIGDNVQMTQKVLGMVWRDMNDDIAVYPFCKLKSLTIVGASPGIVLPSMEVLQLEGSYPGGWSPNNNLILWPYRGTGLAPVLQKLVVVDANLDLSWLEVTLRCPEFRGLRELRVRGAMGWDYDLKRVTDVLTTHQFELQAFEWSSYQWAEDDTSHDPFGSLQPLSKLQELTVNYDLLTPSNDQEAYKRPFHLLNPRSYLPASLKSLYLTAVSTYDLTDLYRAYAETAEQRTTALEFILTIAQTLGLTNLDISVLMEEWANGRMRTLELPKVIRKFIPEVIDALATVGTTLRVWRHKGHYAQKLLYKRSFAARWPHWEDVDQENWCDMDMAIWEVRKGLIEMSTEDQRGLAYELFREDLENSDED